MYNGDHSYPLIYSCPVLHYPHSHHLKCFVVFLLVVLSLDAMDVSGESQIDVISNVFKERLTLDGTPIDAEHEKHGKLTATLEI